jgi:hypothetical protein
MNLETLAEQLKSGAITINEWQAAMRDVVKSELILAMDLAKDGRSNVTPSDWGFVGSQTKALYEKLDGFAADIAADPAKWLNGRALNARMALYGQVGYSALEEDIGREKEKGGFMEERSVLDPAITNHCDGCKEEAGKGWRPIRSLIPIGERDCVSNCRCTMEYRKPDGAGGWIYE